MTAKGEHHQQRPTAHPQSAFVFHHRRDNHRYIKATTPPGKVMANDPTHNPHQGADLAAVVAALATPSKAADVQQPPPPRQPPPGLNIQPPWGARSPAVFGSTQSVHIQPASNHLRVSKIVGSNRENEVNLKEVISSRDRLENMQFKGGLSEKFAAARDKEPEKER